MQRLEQAFATLESRGQDLDVEILIERLEVQLADEVGTVARPVRRPKLLRSAGRWRGPAIAAAAFILVVAVAVPLLLLTAGEEGPFLEPDVTTTALEPTPTSSPAPSPTTLTPPTTLLPTPAPQNLPPIETWTWQMIEGENVPLPVGPIVSTADGFLSADDKSWLRSEDGVSWDRAAYPDAFNGAVPQLAEIDGDVWVLTGADPAKPTRLFRLAGDEWIPLNLGGKPTQLSAPAASGDTVVVPGRSDVGPALWTSTDGGATFAQIDAPWGDDPVQLRARPTGGFVGYAYMGSPGSRLAEIWVSDDGSEWEDAGPAPFTKGLAAFFSYGHRWPVTVVATRSLDDADVDELWISFDGLEWEMAPGLQVPLTKADPGTGSLFVTDFGFAFISFFGLPGDQDSVMAMVSADGEEWEDVSDPTIRYPIETVEESGGMGWWATGNTIFVSRSFESGARTLWVGRFQQQG